MCLILFSYENHPRYRLIFAANRDEFYSRPAQPMAWWPEPSKAPVLAGRDLVGGGTWMGITRNGRWAAITNYRDPASIRADAPTRGRLVSDFLTGSDSPPQYLEQLVPRAKQYNGFNLIVGDGHDACYFGNRSTGIHRLAAGLYGLSNHLLDSPWPKVRDGKMRLARLLEDGQAPDTEAIFSILQNTDQPPDHLLPDTGVGLSLERMLGPLFISSPDYGTRCSTLLLWHRDGPINVWERTYVTAVTPAATDGIQHFHFNLQS